MRRYSPEPGPAFPCLRMAHDAPHYFAQAISHVVIVMRPLAASAFSGPTRLFDRSTRTSMKLWKKGARLKSNRPDKAATLNGQALNHLIQYQKGCFQSGVSLSILARSWSVRG